MKYLIAFLLVGCVSTQSNFSDEAYKTSFYKKDMKISVNGFKSTGTLVLPKASIYNFEFESYGDLDLFTFTTCHREISKEEAGERGIFGNKKKTKVPYLPASIEYSACPIDVGGYDADKGRHSWGFIAIENDAHKLPANVQCNGEQYNSRGTTVCQARTGLVQSLEFERDVVFTFDKTCEPVKHTYKNNVFQFNMVKGNCVIYFKEVDAPNRIHELMLFGYEKILIRKI